MVNKRLLQRHILNKKPLKRFEIKKQVCAQVLENYEILISYVHNEYQCDQNDVVIDNIFVFQVALDIIRNDRDPEPQNVEKCRHRIVGVKMERSYAGILKLVNETRIFWTYSPNT